MKIIIDARTTQDEIKLNGVGRYSRFIIEYLVRNFPNTKFELIMYEDDSTIEHLIGAFENLSVVRIGRYNEKGFVNMIKHNLDLVFHVSLNKALKIIDTSDTVFLSLYFWKGLPVFKIPTVSVIHDFALVVFNIYSTISPFHNILRFIHYWYELLRVYFAKHIIVDASFTITEMKKYLPFMNMSKVASVPLGIFEDKESGDVNQILPKDWKEKGYYIYLGAGLTENKNSRGVVNAYSQFINILKSKGKSIDDIPYLVIAGKNFTDEHAHQATEFRNYVKKIGIDQYVHFTGKYDDSIRWELVRNSIAFIHLSLYEGFGFAVAEAMRAKKPVIVHKGSTYIEVVGDGGILVDGKNPVEVANAMVKVFDDNKYAEEIAQKGYQKSLEYNWDITAKNTFKILKEVYDRHYNK